MNYLLALLGLVGGATVLTWPLAQAIHSFLAGLPLAHGAFTEWRHQEVAQQARKMLVARYRWGGFYNLVIAALMWWGVVAWAPRPVVIGAAAGGLMGLLFALMRLHPARLEVQQTIRELSAGQDLREL